MRENLDQKKSEYRHFSRSDSVFIINLEQLYAYMNLQEDKKYMSWSPACQHILFLRKLYKNASLNLECVVL